MLKLEEIQLDVGRAVGGDWMRMTHTPTGIHRVKMPPIGEKSKVTQQMMLEIEAELLERNLVQYIQSD
jgi:hypothetical protein